MHLRPPLQRWLVRFPLRHANLSEGLRAACGASVMLLLGEWLGNPLFSWAAIGAFLTCLADSAGSNRARLLSMGGFAVLSTLGGVFAASVAGWSVEAGLLAIMACAGVAGFSRIYGAAVGLVMMLAAGVSAIMADAPPVLHPFSHSHVLIYFCGCIWATLLGLTAWRIHPFAPARQAVARVYGALADLAGMAAVEGDQQEPARLAHAADLAAQSRRHARIDLDAARRRLGEVAIERTESRWLYENLLVRLARAGELLDCLTVLVDLRLTHYQSPRARRRTGRILHAMAQLMRAMQRDFGKPAGAMKSPADDARVMMRLRQLVARLPAATTHRLQLAQAPLAESGSADAADLKHAARSAVVRPIGMRAGWARVRGLWRRALLHVEAGSDEWQHGWRCAAAAGATYLIVHLLELPFGYWATMATMLVMQPTIADSWSRSLERAIGSVVGGALAVVLSLFIHSPLALALLVFPLTVLTMALRPVSYGLYATFLTPVFVLVADVGGDPGQQLSNAMLRGGNNVIGTVVALLASYLFWPRRQRADLPGQLARMAALNIACLRQAVHGAGDAAAMHAGRRDACVANVEAGLMLQRLAREGGLHGAQREAARSAVALSRRLAAAASHLWLHPQGAMPALDQWLGEMAAALEDCASARQRQALQTLRGVLQARPAPVQLAAADAVETLCLLATALYPQNTSQRD
ncbi:FUSC family protein [Herbaspirillum sp. alder98]|uniref:FUSC family protein n=1 Tax=Herbaspirillum sp. alder98 TaxID=2913096 RepID=UPI001CD892CD|nr:FUSC family protein [Herbaspirillum sp. alder98]MCA1325846.1 FUSC family protein [Herbaspirillum sp. alder98]